MMQTVGITSKEKSIFSVVVRDQKISSFKSCETKYVKFSKNKHKIKHIKDKFKELRM